jgi:2-polyprenyl-3-methyl-5-hydroxy-6-metoxy-1,4-benzoquinol methylase
VENYRFNAQDNLWIPEGNSIFSYSDGDEVEERIYRIIKSAVDRHISSIELLQNITDWPSEYHLSPLRNNLLRPFFFKPEYTILEVGCGCGAITRQLGETGAKVLAVEGSYRRAKIAAERCRDLSNVQVYCDNIQRVNLQDKVDVVTLIGVLEYARLFVEATEPIQSMLEICRKNLVENGILIIAIENQLGLKYFNGASEDHTGGIFDSIQDLYGEKTVVTFGKQELRSRLEAAGFSAVEFLYPFPDYKLPQLILQEEALLQENFRVGQLIGQYRSRDYSGQHNRLFLEDLCWPVLERNKIIGDLSNSFLVLASNNPEKLRQFKGDWLAKTYSVGRKPEYWTENTFTRKGEKIVVEKKKLLRDKESKAKIIHLLGTSEYVNGDLYMVELSRRLRHGNAIQTFIEWLGPWVNFLHAHQLNDSTEDGAEQFLPGSFIDCTPLNLIAVSKGNLHYIDIEWDLNEPIPLKWVFFRGVINSLQSLSRTDLQRVLEDTRPVDIVLQAALKYQIGIQEEDILSLLEKEACLHATVYPDTGRNYLRLSLEWLYQSFGTYVNITDVFDQRKNQKVYIETKPVTLQIYYSTDGLYDETCSQIFEVNADGNYQTFELELPSENASRIRIDPVNKPTFVELQSVEIIVITENNEEYVWYSFGVHNNFAELQILNGIQEITREGRFLFLTYHDDPNFEIQLDSNGLAGKIIKLRITLAVHTLIHSLLAQQISQHLSIKNDLLIALKDSVSQRESLIDKLNWHLQNKDQMINQLEEELDELNWHLQNKDQMIKQFEEELSDTRIKLEQLLEELAEKSDAEQSLREKVHRIHEEKEVIAAQRAMMIKDLAQLQQKYHEITNSKSWRYTQPLRTIAKIVKRTFRKRG